MSTLTPLAVVTGVSSDIGMSYARKLLEQGYDLIAVGRRKERLDVLAADPLDAGATADKPEASERSKPPMIFFLLQRLPFPTA